MRPLLDTHIWLWWIGGEPHLSKREMESLDELPGEQRPFISDISLWEVAVLLELGARAGDIPLFTRDRRILDARLTKKWAM
jgi:PIN domain nuclease of toxin-antitoxin system